MRDQLDAVPAEMRDQARWVVWRAEERNGKKTKVPYQPARPNKGAKSTDPSTWSDLDTACAAAERDKSISGVGFMFGGSGLVGIDLDHCLLNGELRPWAKDIWDQFAPVSYCEFSPSGDGLHFITKGSLPPGAWNKKERVHGFSNCGLEMYDSGRYFTVTGNADMTYKTIGDGQAAIEWLQAEHAKRKPEKTRQEAPRTHAATKQDQDIVERAQRAANGAKFDALMRGDLSGHGDDHSLADAALCALLAFWTRDPEQIDRIFRTSGLMRDKWDSKRGDTTYGRITIEKALDTVTDQAGTVPGQEPELPKVTENYQNEQTAQAGNPFDDCLNIAELLATEPPEMQWFAKDRLPQGRGFLLTGVGGVSKSTMLKQLGFAAVLGRALWGWEFPRTGKALLMLTEDTSDDAHTSLKDIADAMLVTPAEKSILASGLYMRPFAGQDSLLLRKDKQGRLCRSALYEQLLAKVKALGDCVFVGIDPALAVSEGDELDQQSQRALAKMADDLAVNTGATVMLVTHGTKALIGADEIGSHSSRGGGAVTDGARGEYVLRSMTTQEAKRAGIDDPEERARIVQLVCSKGNRIPPSAKVPVWLRRGNGGVLSEVVLDMTSGASCTTDTKDDKIFEVLLDIGKGGPAKRQEWMEACAERGILRGKASTQNQYMKEAASRLKAAGKVVSYTTGYYSPCDPDPEPEW